MKEFLYTILLFSLFSVAASAQNEVITIFEGVKIKNDKRAEALFYYENNWQMLRIKALEKGYIHSFELIEAKADKEADFDIILVTRYLNNTQYEKAEERFQELIKQRGGLKLLNKIKPSDFRQNVFVKVGKSSLGRSSKSP